MYNFSLGSVFVDIILLIVVAGTTGWVSAGTLQVGLFKYCFEQQCGPTLTLLQLASDGTVSACKASQAFVVLAILLDSLLIVTFVLRIIATSAIEYPRIAALMAQIPAETETVLAALIAVSVTIVWAAGLSLRFGICDLAGEDQPCEVNFSFVMTMIVWSSSLSVLYDMYWDYSREQQKLRDAANAVQNLAVPAPVNNYQVQPGPVYIPTYNASGATAFVIAPPRGTQIKSLLSQLCVDEQQQGKSFFVCCTWPGRCFIPHKDK
jgi:hypothetical protein